MAARRAFTNEIDYIGAFGLPGTSFISDFDNPAGTANASAASSPVPTRLEGNVAPGDSGGGIFVERGGVRYLVGLNSYQASIDGATDADYGDLSGGTNLALYYDWIFAESGISPVLIPEPGTGVLFAFWVGAALLRRRR